MHKLAPAPVPAWFAVNGRYSPARLAMAREGRPIDRFQASRALIIPLRRPNRPFAARLAAGHRFNRAHRAQPLAMVVIFWVEEGVVATILSLPAK